MATYQQALPRTIDPSANTIAVQRLDAHTPRAIRRRGQTIRIISGTAWITMDGADFVLIPGETLYLIPGQSHAVIEGMNHMPLIYGVE